MMLPSFLMPASMLRRREEMQQREVERRIPLAVPWTPDIKWAPEMNIRAKTYKTYCLFDVKPLRSNDINTATMSQVVQSPKKNFIYAEKRLKRGSMLQTMNGRRKGDVLFDGDVLLPCLHEVACCGSGWDVNPWMSLTPMEMMTLRPGTKRAKGRVIVAGLGLGYQLIEVSKRPQVKELVLVEKSQELVDWLLPRIRPMLARELTDVVVGDAYQKLRKMKADVALIDIFPSYGFNRFTHWVPDGNGNREEPIPTPGIKSIWCWGGVQLRD